VGKAGHHLGERQVYLLMSAMMHGNDTAARRKPGERGSTLILFSFLLSSLLIPIIGLAIDGSIIWWMKTKLSSAVDA
jgi:uncharacterized Tic20 family protein